MLSDRLKPSRYPSRASQDIEVINKALDSGLFCTVAFIRDGLPFQIPTGFCRIGTKIYIHASSKSGFIDSVVDENVSFSVTHMDALILAPTAFDHSFNYRSVIGFSKAIEITSEEEKLSIFRVFTDRYIPGRIADVGDPTHDQMKITRIMELSLDQCAIKMRDGDSGTEHPEKHGKWVGTIPVKRVYQKPVPDERIKDWVVPDYIRELID